MRKVIHLFIFSLFSLSVPASDFSFFAGWADVSFSDSVAQPIRFNNFNAFGGRFEKDFFVMFGFENTIAFSNDSMLTTADENDRGLYYTGNLVVNLPIRRILTFVTGGLGVSHKFGDSFPDVGSRFLTNWGAGLKVRRIAGPVGVRVDYRRFTTHGVLGGSVKTNEISAGIMLTFHP